MLFRLSKSKLLSGIQCPKRLYLEVHRPELADQSDGTGRLFANGHRVGEIARQAWPKGRLVEHPFDRTAALKQTSEMLEGSGSMTLFEAAFQHGGLFARADVLSRTRGQCNVVEVKSSGKVTEYHETDAAIQRWVIHNAGYPVKSIAISHIDTSFVYPGNNRYEGLFKAVDVTEQALEQQTQVPRWISTICPDRLLGGRVVHASPVVSKRDTDTIGAEIEPVPSVAKPSTAGALVPSLALTPPAKISPSSVALTVRKVRPFSVAPTVSALGAVPGELSVARPGPSFPAEITTITPEASALATARTRMSFSGRGA